jgi:hypothetical protein
LSNSEGVESDGFAGAVSAVSDMPNRRCNSLTSR